MLNVKKFLAAAAEAFKPARPADEIGLNGTADEFRAAMKESSLYISSRKTDLYTGALKAFREQRPENLQVFMSEFPDDFYSVVSRTGGAAINRILHAVTKGAADTVTATLLALGKASDERKQEMLNNALEDAVVQSQYAEPFVAMLIRAGARVDQKDSRGWDGSLLVEAIMHDEPVSYIKLLHDNGGSFEKALLLMQVKSLGQSNIDNLYRYREQITGEKPPVVEPPVDVKALLAEIQQLRQEMTALTAAVKTAVPTVSPVPPVPGK